jgi:hypothetical protein
MYPHVSPLLPGLNVEWEWDLLHVATSGCQ